MLTYSRRTGHGIAWVGLLGGCIATIAVAGPGSNESLGRFEASPMFVVTRMLEMAGVTSYDVVYDLGAGDGRIVITAADRYGAKGVGVENDPEIAAVARDRVKKFNVADRVTILEADVMKVDISAATVVTMYLAPRAYRMLKPRLQNQLAPGTRVVTHGTPIPGWTPIDTVSVAHGLPLPNPRWRYA